MLGTDNNLMESFNENDSWLSGGDKGTLVHGSNVSIAFLSRGKISLQSVRLWRLTFDHSSGLTTAFFQVTQGQCQMKEIYRIKKRWV